MSDHTLLVTATQMRELEERSVQAGATWAGLMEQAGRGVAGYAREMLGDSPTRRVLVLVGPGNNGGDGLVAARYLHDWGARVTVYVWKRRADSADANWQAVQMRKLPTIQSSDDPQQQQLVDLLRRADLVIDGLLGVGVSRPLSDDVAAIVETVNAATVPVLAIDVPSGLNADTGAIWAHIIDADCTVATGLIKRGHRLYPGAAHVGRVVVAPVDLNDFEEPKMTSELNAETLQSLLPARPDDSHKGTYGKTMVVAGSYFYPGAATLAATAATRSGTGLVTLACPRSIYGGTLAALHEATYLPLPEKEAGALSPAAAEVLTEKLEGYTALLIGCGLGHEESTGEFLQRVLGLHTSKRKIGVGFLATKADDDADDQQPELPPLVIDADGLNLLSTMDGWADRLRDHPTILTPHPGEMARLLDVEHIEDDHPQVALDAARQWGVVVVLKTAHTVVAAPDGRSAIHGRGNAALATAGTGDVLAGLIAGLLAQGLEPFDAARLGVGVHALAGSIARDELGARGVVAGDLLPRLPLAFRRLEQRSR